MESEIDQVVRAILVASDPSQGALHQQALAYLQTIQQNAANTWRLALAIFVDGNADGSRKHAPQARFFALRVLDDFLDNRFDPLDEDSFRTLQQSLVGYIQSEYIYGSAESNATFLRNKFSHTLTLFFLCTYIEQWPTFFRDLFTLLRPAEGASSSSSTFNPHISLLVFHLVLEISGEVADQTIKSARVFDEARHRRDGLVRDAVRERDAPAINQAVTTIVAAGEDRLRALRAAHSGADAKEIATTVEVVDWGVRTFGSYVGWIDISLTVTPDTVRLLFTLLSDPSLPIRLATALALTRITAKGLKEPGDKLQLIKVLALGQVIDELEKRTREEQRARGKEADEDEESFREALGRLLNQLGVELMKLVEEATDEAVRAEAMRLVNQVLPVMLRIIGDAYDDTSSTVFPFLLAVLANYKRMQKASSHPLEDDKRAFLASLLQVIIQKMRWDEDDEDPDDLDDEERAAFEGLRKDLRSFMESILATDADLVINAIRTLVINTLTTHQNGGSLEWQDAELAIYLVFILGDINKTGVKGRAAFVQAPAVPREQRKEVDYSTFPLTTHGEMLMALCQSRISGFPHKAVAMQFFETIARYGDFFKVRKECILPTLEAMVDNRGLHNSDPTVQSRVFYLFQRFIRESKADIPSSVALTLLQGVRDLLEPKVEIPEPEAGEESQDLLAEALATQGFFDAQLYLFETVGLLISLFHREPAQQSALLLSVAEPLLDRLQSALGAVKSAQDVLPILTVHHVMMALGNVAKGFPEYPSPIPEGHAPPPAEFQRVASAILVSLEAMNGFRAVRDAARFAFARILATTGPASAYLIPPLMANLLARFEPSELADFMNFIALSIHKLQQDFVDVLDQLVGPLNTHIAALLAQPVTGTDDQLTHADTKKSYLALLNGIMAAKLHGVFLSDRNKDAFETLLTSMEQVAEDPSDPASQKAAFVFLGRCVSVWGVLPSADGATGGLPGFERFIYERLVPSAFRVIALPQFNIKDGQILVVLHEIANFLQITVKTRGQEAYDFLLGVFLPSQGWPTEVAMDFCTKMRDLDLKTFRKYFADMVRGSRA